MLDIYSLSRNRVSWLLSPFVTEFNLDVLSFHTCLIFLWFVIGFLLVTKSSFLALAVQPCGASWCRSCRCWRYQISSIFYPCGLGRTDEMNVMQGYLHTFWSCLGQASPAHRRLCRPVTCGAQSPGITTFRGNGGRKGWTRQFFYN